MTSENYVANTLFGFMQYGRYDACRKKEQIKNEAVKLCNNY